MILSTEEQAAALQLARETLQGAFGGKLPQGTSFENGSLQEKLPCFVSLHGPTKRLRGCIGCTSSDVSLAATIQRMTLAAAFEDPRFRPVSAEELEKLHIEVSVLGPLMPLPGLSVIRMGTHGLKVARGRRAGLLLAQVAVQQKWTVDEFMSQTCLKAGLEPKQWQTYESWYFEQVCFSERSDLA